MAFREYLFAYSCIWEYERRTSVWIDGVCHRGILATYPCSKAALYKLHSWKGQMLGAFCADHISQAKQWADCLEKLSESFNG